MRELPMMEQVKNSSLEIVLAFIFHDITELIRRAEVVQRMGKSMYSAMLACRVTLPGAWHCHLGQSEGLQEMAEQQYQHVEGFEVIL